MFFFEKKNQKTFAYLGSVLMQRRIPRVKVFLFLFLQKKKALIA